MDLKRGETRQLTEAEGLDGASLALLPDDRSFCYFADAPCIFVNLVTPRERKLYEVRRVGTGVWNERVAGRYARPPSRRARRRLAAAHGDAAARGGAHVVEAPVEMSDPIARFRRAQILYRQADEALWLVDSDGNRTAGSSWQPGASRRPIGRRTARHPVLELSGRPDAVKRHPRIHTRYGQRQTCRQRPAVRALRIQPRHVGVRGGQPQCRVAHRIDSAARDASGTDAVRAQGQPSGNGGAGVRAG